MTNEFKVIPWLRKTREEHAARQAGLTDAEKIELDRKEAGTIIDRLFKRHEIYRESVSAFEKVAEKREPYGS